MRSSKSITYHGRRGHPEVHVAKSGRRYILVRAAGGGVKRLYEGSKYYVEPTRRGGKRTFKRLVL